MVAAGWTKVTRRSVQKLWLRHKKSILNPEKYVHDVSRKKGGGRKGINVEELQRKVKETPFSDRQTIRRLSLVINVLKTTLHRSLKIGALQRAASSIKPHLTPQNKEHRVAYCRSFVEGDNYFSDMMD